MDWTRTSAARITSYNVCYTKLLRTRDGYSTSVMANIELFEEVAQVLDNGAEGVGLLRTEYRYMNRRELPTEDELFEEYSDLASILSPRSLTIRTRITSYNVCYTKLLRARKP